MAKVLLKKSSVTGNVPSADSLVYGELAINIVDGKLYYKNSSNEIKSFADSDALTSSYLNLSTGGTLSGAINMNTNRILNLADPADSSDPATKSYVDAAVVLSAQGVIEYPIGDYGSVDSAGAVDAFGVATSLETYDHMTPSGAIVNEDHGSDASV